MKPISYYKGAGLYHPIKPTPPKIPIVKTKTTMLECAQSLGIYEEEKKKYNIMKEQYRLDMRARRDQFDADYAEQNNLTVGMVSGALDFLINRMNVDFDHDIEYSLDEFFTTYRNIKHLEYKGV